MGLFTGLVTLPLAPVRGVVWVAEQVQQAAERRFYDPEPVKRELARLERELLSGRIDQETFDRCEDELLDRLEEIQRFREANEP